PASAAKTAATTHRLRKANQTLARTRPAWGTSVMQATEYKMWSGSIKIRAKARPEKNRLRVSSFVMAKTRTQLMAAQRTLTALPATMGSRIQRLTTAETN